MNHRRGREAEIVERLDAAGTDIENLTRSIYTDVPAGLLPAAARNVFAHLIDLHRRGVVEADPTLGRDAHYYLKAHQTQP